MPGMSGENGEALRIETHRGVHVIHFNRLVTNRLVVERMNQEIHALLEAETERPRFVVDFTDVKEMSSSILGVMMSVNLKICRSGGELRLCGIRRALLDVLRLMRLDTILNIDPTFDEALARMSD